MKRSILCLLGFLLISFVLRAQGYKIRFEVDGLRDTTAYLGYYYGELFYIRDTARVDSKGMFVFEGKQALPRGIYFLVLNSTSILELIMGDDQQFTLATNTTDYLGNMRIAGDTDNAIFYENLKFIARHHTEADPYLKVIRDSTLAESKKVSAREASRKITDKVVAYQEALIRKYPGTITARILKAGQPVKIPDAPKRANGSIDSSFQLKWYREHFFDNFDLAEDAFIRMRGTPYATKVEEYLDRLFVPHPDSIAKAIDAMASRAKKNTDTYKYLVWTCYTKYYKPKYMGLDEVQIHLYDRYFATGEMDYWTNESLRKNVKDQAERLRSSRLGKIANNLILMDPQEKMRSLHHMRNKYTIVYFFLPDCGECKKTTPRLTSLLEKTKRDIGVYAVSADSSMAKLRDYITEMRTDKFVNVCFYYSAVGNFRGLYDAETYPTIYLLDEKKKIIAKKIAAEDIEDFLNRYERSGSSGAQ